MKLIKGNTRKIDGYVITRFEAETREYTKGKAVV
jgi:hypothetical protein